MPDRREFLRTTVAASVAALAPGRLMAAVEKRTAPLPDLSTWPAVRAQFNLRSGQLHFSTFFLVSHPRPVRDAIEAFRRALDDEPYLAIEQQMAPTDPNNIQYKIRDEMAGYLGAKRDEIAVTFSTTASLALVYAGLPLTAADEILTTTHDHFSHHRAIQFAVAKAGAAWRAVPLYDRPAEASITEIVLRLKKAIRPGTRAVGVTWVHSSTGVRLPIRAMADALRDVNKGRDPKDQILLVVDGVHGLGAVDEPVGALGCDFFAAGTHKWMFGPRGTGILWGRLDRWALLRPTIPSFYSVPAWEAWFKGEADTRPTTSYDVSPGGFTAYEHQWAMGAAFKFHERIGRARVASRIRELNDQCKAGLAGMKKVTVHTPRDPNLSAGLVAFEVEGVGPDDVVKRLLARNIVASTTPYRVSYARLAPSLLNDPAEVDAVLRAVREI
jgi:selenocysteine lyase/cysteine desulfurase